MKPHPTSPPRPCSKICCGFPFLKWLAGLFQGSMSILMAISAIVIAFQQHVIIQENRNRDILIAAEQRQQDLKIERLQREEDLNISCLQNDEDFEVFQLQREQDINIHQLRRTVDQEIIATQHNQTKTLQGIQRKLMDEQQREDLRIAYTNKFEDLNLEINRQQETTFVKYQEELLAILLRYGFEKTYRDEGLIFEIQMNTRTALRKLNPLYRRLVIDLLFEAGIFSLEYKKPDDAILAHADLSNVDFGFTRQDEAYRVDIDEDVRTYNQIRMRGANLRNGSLRMSLMADIKPDLIDANLDYFDWMYSSIDGVRFEKCSMNGAGFLHTSLTGVVFSKVQLNHVSFRQVTKCNKCQFQSLSMFKADLSQAKFAGALFNRVSLIHANLSYSYHKDSEFNDVDMTYVDFTKTNFTGGTFIQAKLIMCQFLDTRFFDCQFNNVTMTGCINFNQSNWIKITFRSSILPNGTFVLKGCLNC